MPYTPDGAQSLAEAWLIPQASRIALFTGEAVVGSSGNELATAGYIRGAFNTGDLTYNASSRIVSNVNSISLGTVTAQTPSITHWAILNAANAIIWRDVFATPTGALASGTALFFAAGNISLTVNLS